MSYLVLARKWRPQTFDEVAGQRHVTQTLQNAIEMGRLAHALIFSGVRGVGKTSVARILARAINCADGPARNPCNKCAPCLEITQGRSADVQEIDAASNRGIDEIRLLRENCRFRPSLCRCRVYIIDEAHMLTKEAFNALLKTLEEPPDHVYFILATTEPQKIPVTIHSRCQHHAFRRLSAAGLAEHLDKIVHAEALGLDRNITTLLARQAGGSVRDALSLLDQVVAFGAASLKDACEALGVISSQVLCGMAKAVMEGDIHAVLAIIDEVQGYGVDLRHFASDLALYFRDLLVLKGVGPARAGGLVALDEEDLKDLGQVLSGVSRHALLQMLDALVKGLDGIAKTSTPRMSLEIILMRLCHMREVVGIDEVLKRLGEMSHAEGAFSDGQASSTGCSKCQGPAASASAGPEAAASEVIFSDGTSASPDKSWGNFCRFVAKKRPSLASMLECCIGTDIRVDSGRCAIRLTCSPGMHYDLLRERDNQACLGGFAEEFYGVPVDLVAELSKEASADVCLSSGKKSSQDRDDLMQSPLVKEAMKVFDARVADVKIFSRGK